MSAPMIFDGCVGFGPDLYPLPKARARIRINPAFASWCRDQGELPSKWECYGGGVAKYGQTPEAAWKSWALWQKYEERAKWP